VIKFWLAFALALAAQARAEWRAPAGDWTRAPRLAPREAWERLAALSTPVPSLTSLPSLIGTDFLYAWQHTISGHDGSQCPYYPTCSRYSRIAVEQEGLVVGCMMTAERLLHCHEHASDLGQYAWRDTPAGYKLWDPPSMDAWWR
jgi:putative component of membrane protein insertase Oxa1/YidC/SpoIIIJ protein YidD